MQNRGCGWVAAIIAGALVAGGALLVLVQWLETVASPAGIVLVAVLIAAPVLYGLGVIVVYQLGGLRGPAGGRAHETPGAGDEAPAPDVPEQKDGPADDAGER